MEIKGFKDLEIVKNALTYYITEIENAIQLSKDNEHAQLIIDSLEKDIIRSKELIDEADNEFNDTLNIKVQEKIASGDVIKINPLKSE